MADKIPLGRFSDDRLAPRLVVSSVSIAAKLFSTGWKAALVNAGRRRAGEGDRFQPGAGIPRSGIAGDRKGYMGSRKFV